MVNILSPTSTPRPKVQIEVTSLPIVGSGHLNFILVSPPPPPQRLFEIYSKGFLIALQIFVKVKSFCKSKRKSLKFEQVLFCLRSSDLRFFLFSPFVDDVAKLFQRVPSLALLENFLLTVF